MIGVLGGMGPESTAYTYMRMIRYCQEKYDAMRDSDYPPIFIYSMPTPDVVEKEWSERDLLPLLRQGILKLNSSGADFCIIPCNSVQKFVPKLRKSATILSIVEETLKEAKKNRIGKWGILATGTTIKSQVYQDAFGKAGIDVAIPSDAEQTKVNKAIMAILSGKNFGKARKMLLEVLGSLKRRGTGGAILACTDLPIVLQDVEGMKLLDTADIIAKAAVDYYRRS